MASLRRKSSKRFKKEILLFLFIGILGITIFVLGAYQKYREAVLSFSETPNQTDSNIQKNASPPVHISISDSGIDLPIETTQIINGVWEISQNSASYLSSSARPGENGNIIIYGHNKKKIFGNLIGRDLMGDIITIKTLDGRMYKYKITSTKIVDPTDTSEVLPTNNEILTLYTCTGFMDTKRLIIKAAPSV